MTFLSRKMLFSLPLQVFGMRACCTPPGTPMRMLVGISQGSHSALKEAELLSAYSSSELSHWNNFLFFIFFIFDRVLLSRSYSSRFILSNTGAMGMYHHAQIGVTSLNLNMEISHLKLPV